MSIYFDGKTVTVYDSAENSLTKYTLPADSADGTADSTPRTLPALPDLPDLHRRRAGEVGPDGRSGRDRAGVGGRAPLLPADSDPEL